MALSEALNLLLLVSLFFTLSTCKPVISNQRRHVLEDVPIIEKRQGGFFSVLGAAGVRGTDTYPRLEIRELEKNADQWNVYLLGLRRFQNVSQSDKLSYYQIAGMCAKIPDHERMFRIVVACHMAMLLHLAPVTSAEQLANVALIGIHGRPYTAWDGVNQVTGGSGGYCTHGSNIFPTWHRPYLALFEVIGTSHNNTQLSY